MYDNPLEPDNYLASPRVEENSCIYLPLAKDMIYSVFLPSKAGGGLGGGEITCVPRWVEVGSDDSGPLVGKRIRGIGRSDNFDR